MRPSPRLLLTSLALLAGCESQITVDLTDGPTDGAQAVTLDVTHVVLRTDTGGIARFALDSPGPVDVLALRNGETFRLVGDETIAEDRYTGIALDFAATGSFVTQADGTDVTVNPPASRTFADIDLDVGEMDAEHVVLALNLRFSLVDDGAGAYDLDPVVRAVRPSGAGTITGLVPAAVVESTGCQAGRAAGEGVAVYAFTGSGVTPNDYVGQAALIDADDVEFDADSGDYRYELNFLPAGAYTLALTCDADADEPDTDDAVAFESSLNASALAKSTVQVNF